MFGLSKLEAGLIAGLALVLLLSGLAWRFGAYERKVEHTIDVAADNKAVGIQEKHDATADAAANADLKRQNLALADWIAKHPPGDAHLLVCGGPANRPPRAPVVAGAPPAVVPGGGGAPVLPGDSAAAPVDIEPRVRLLAIVAERAATIARACELRADKIAAP